MMARPWAKATGVIPLRPAPRPTTAAAPAPMNTNEKVPMNSARSLGAIRLDIIFSRDKFGAWREPFTPRVTLASPRHLLTDARLREPGAKLKYASASQTALVRLLRLH